MLGPRAKARITFSFLGLKSCLFIMTATLILFGIVGAILFSQREVAAVFHSDEVLIAALNDTSAIISLIDEFARTITRRDYDANVELFLSNSFIDFHRAFTYLAPTSGNNSLLVSTSSTGGWGQQLFTFAGGLTSNHLMISNCNITQITDTTAYAKCIGMYTYSFKFSDSVTTSTYPTQYVAFQPTFNATKHVTDGWKLSYAIALVNATTTLLHSVDTGVSPPGAVTTKRKRTYEEDLIAWNTLQLSINALVASGQVTSALAVCKTEQYRALAETFDPLLTDPTFTCNIQEPPTVYLNSQLTCIEYGAIHASCLNTSLLSALSLFGTDEYEFEETLPSSISLVKLPQTANQVFASPPYGAPDVPTFRGLTTADLPPGNLSAGVTGVLPPANGGTGYGGPYVGDMIVMSATDGLSLTEASFMGTNGVQVTQGPGPWVTISGTGGTCTVPTDQTCLPDTIVLQMLTVYGATYLGTNTSCAATLDASCYDISNQMCPGGPIDNGCINPDLVLNSLTVNRLVIFNTSISVTGETTTDGINTTYLTVDSVVLHDDFQCVDNGSIAQNCYDISSKACATPLANSCFPSNQTFANVIVTDTTTVNTVVCVGAYLGDDCIPSRLRTINSIEPSASPAFDFQILGTTSQVVVTGGVGLVTLSLPQNIHTSATPTFSSATLNAATNQLQLGTTTINAIAPASPITLSIHDPGAAANFVLDTAGALTITALPTSGQVLTAINSTTANWATPTTGTVTSVALSVPTILSVTGSPITTSGTLAITLATQSANTIFAGPASGVAAIPTVRAQVLADLPQLTNGQLYVGSTGVSVVAAAITGTTNQITVALGAGTIGLSLPQNIHTAATPTFASGTLTATTNQLTFGTTTTTTISAIAPAVSRTLTIHDPGAAANFVLDRGGALTITTAPNTGDVLTAINATTANWAPPSTGNGTVTSVAMTVPSILSISGSPITISGTLALTLATQTANKLFAGPASGAAATPTFRTPVLADLPQLTNGQLYVGSTGLSVVAAAITGTTNQITVALGAGTIGLSLPQNIHTAATPTFASGTLTATTNQLVLGTTTTTTLSAIAPAASRVISIHDPGAAANVVLTTGGALTITNTPAATQVLTAVNTTAATWQSSSVTLAGDVTGGSGANTVVKLQGFAIQSTTPTDGAVLAWDTVTPGWIPRTSVIYYGTNTQLLSGTTSITIGQSASTLGCVSAVAIGNAASTAAAAATGAIAIGLNSISQAIGSIAIGNTATTSTSGTAAVSIGLTASALGTNAVAIGRTPVANAADGIAIGRTATVSTTGTASVAIGWASVGSAQFAVAIGVSSTVSTTGTSSVAIGNTASGTGTSAIAIGNAPIAQVADGIAIGRAATVSSTGTSSVAIGLNSVATAATAVAIGVSSTTVNCTSAVAIGNTASTGQAAAGASAAVAIGATASAAGTDAVAIGSATIGNAATAVVLGKSATVSTTGTSSVAIGLSTVGSAATSVVIGVSSTVSTTGTSSVAIGNTASSTGTSAIAIGNAPIAQVADGIAIGRAATVSTTGTSSVAIGLSTVGSAATSVAIGVSATVSTTGTSSVAIGNTASATGTTAVAIGNLAVANVANAVVLGRSATASTTGTSAVVIGLSAIGSSASAVVVGSLATVSTTGTSSVAIGTSASATGATATAVGNLAIANAANGVAVGKSCTVSTTGTASFAGGLSASATGTNAIAIGNAPIANVADGISIGRAATVSTTGTSSIAIGLSSIGSAASAVVIGASATVSTTGASSVAIGAAASATGSGNIAIGYGSVSSGSLFGLAIGYTASVSVAGDYAVALGYSATITAAGGIAIGQSSSVATSSSIAIGVSALVSGTATNSIAIGSAAGSTTVPDSISIGSGANPLDTSHALSLVVNNASAASAFIGITLNGAARVIPTYPSAYTTTGAGPTTLTSTSSYIQSFTVAQVVTLPLTTTLNVGHIFKFVNLSAGNLTVQSSGGNSVVTLATGTWGFVFCKLASGTTAASWTALVGGAAL